MVVCHVKRTTLFFFIKLQPRSKCNTFNILSVIKYKFIPLKKSTIINKIYARSIFLKQLIPVNLRKIETVTYSCFTYISPCFEATKAASTIIPASFHIFSTSKICFTPLCLAVFI
jgi:hypothetical protein